VISEAKNEIVFNGSRRRPAYISFTEYTTAVRHPLTVGIDPALNCRRSYSMRKILPVMAILSGALVLGNVAGHAAPITGVGNTVYGSAPIGHLQPRAQPITPQSPAEQAEQQQMSTFDVQQRKEDAELDKRLNICRGC
jgi:hypothetical protein